MSGSGSQDSLDRAKLDAIKQQGALGTQIAGLAGKADQRQQKAFDQTFPFFTERMQRGLDFLPALLDADSGLTARAFAPARGRLERRLQNLGDLPSGFAEQSRQDLDAAEARAFDDQMRGDLFANEQSKLGGAAGLTGQLQINNPLGYYSAASGARNSVIGAPNLPADPQTDMINGIIGGAAGAALSFF